MIMAIDPSSTVCGWAVMQSESELVTCGVLRGGRKAPAIIRVCDMANDLQRIEQEFHPDTVVVELPDHHVAGRIAKRAAGLATYGMAVGAVYFAISERRSGIGMVAVPAHEWTGEKSKTMRAALIVMEFPAYRAFHEEGRDNGYDAADAIGIARWWFASQRRERIEREATPV